MSNEDEGDAAFRRGYQAGYNFAKRLVKSYRPSSYHANKKIINLASIGIVTLLESQQFKKGIDLEAADDTRV